MSRLVPISGTPDQRAAAIAAQQRGRVRRSQLLDAAITRSMIETMLARGRLHPRHRGVYAVGHLAPGELTQETEALLACPDGTLLSCISAGALWQFLPPPSPNDPVDVTVRGTHQPSRSGIRAHRTSTLEARDARVHRGLPVTSPARTLFDISALVSERQLERGLDDALNRHIVRLSQVREILDRAGGNHPGAPLLDALVSERERGSGNTRSHAESALRQLIRSARLPPPEANVALGSYEVDMLWRDQRLIVEIDSYEHHLRRASFENDRRRDADLEARGFTVLRFTARQIADEPFVIIARLAAALVWSAERRAST